ncbi:MAG: molybdopterin converting factor subunit 1 [Candidatus Eisenbacteria bacterium]
MIVTVRYFGPAAEDAGVPEEKIELPSGARLSSCIEAFMKKHPALAARREYLRCAVNLECAEGDRPLGDGDEIAVMPPVAGG